jgi:hypothetical protein
MALVAISNALLAAANGISSRIDAITEALPGGDNGSSGAVDDDDPGLLRLPMERFKLLEKLRRKHPKKYAALIRLARSRGSPGLREPNEVVKARVVGVLRQGG